MHFTKQDQLDPRSNMGIKLILLQSKIKMLILPQKWQK
jgi:hypothetical protein